MSLLTGYLEHFKRVERYLARIEQDNRDSIDYDDDLWSFFRHCGHLKDWIKNDPAVPVTLRKLIEGIVERSINLRLCADPANRSKHLELKKHRRKGADTIQRNATVYTGTPGLSRSEHIIETDDGNRWIAQEIARKAVDEW